MKKILITLLLIGLIIAGVVVISRNGKDAVVPMDGLEASTIVSDQLNTVDGVSLGRVKYDRDNSSIKYTLKNKTMDNIYFGEEVILEKKQNGVWHIVPYSGEIGFTSILNYLSPSEKIDRTLPINTWIPLTPGEYRIIIEVSLSEGWKSLHKISGSFKISM